MTAATICVYPVQRQIVPESASRTAASVGLGVLREPGVHGHQDARRAEAALQRMMPPERSLQGRERAVLARKTFDGAQLLALDLEGVGEAGPGGRAVDLDRAGAADAMLAADMGPGEAEAMAQEVDKQHPRLRLALDRFSVQGEADRVPPASFKSHGGSPARA